MTKMSRTLVITLLGLAVTATAFAGPHEERRREERREERREDRREDRREEHRVERRDDRVRDHRYEGPRAAPPAVRYERHGDRRGYTWVGGNYAWQGGAYVWQPGRYEAERRGYRWREPRWEVRDGVYMRVDGDWIVTGPWMAPPVLREERFETRSGFMWIRGQWDWRGGEWAWVPG